MVEGQRKVTYNKGLNAMQTEVLNSAFVLQFSIKTKLNICIPNPALRQAPNPKLFAVILTHVTCDKYY